MTTQTRVEWFGRLQVHQPVKAADYQAIANDAQQRAAEYRSLTEQHTLMGAIFNYAQPLPHMPTYKGREWEPTTNTHPKGTV